MRGNRFRPYGFPRLNLIYADSRLAPNNQFPFFVVSEDTDKNDEEFDIHPRLTRLGVEVGRDSIPRIPSADQRGLDRREPRRRPRRHRPGHQCDDGPGDHVARRLDRSALRADGLVHARRGIHHRRPTQRRPRSRDYDRRRTAERRDKRYKEGCPFVGCCREENLDNNGFNVYA